MFICWESYFFKYFCVVCWPYNNFRVSSLANCGKLTATHRRFAKATQLGGCVTMIFHLPWPLIRMSKKCIQLAGALLISIQKPAT